MNERREIAIYADGSITPVRAGVGVVVQDQLGDVVLVANRSMEQAMTNNEAEYYGLLLAMEIGKRFAENPIEFRLDSEVVVNQMLGHFAVRSQALKALHQQAVALSRHIPYIHFRHVRREANQIAHALAGEAARGHRWCSRGL